VNLLRREGSNFASFHEHDRIRLQRFEFVSARRWVSISPEHWYPDKLFHDFPYFRQMTILQITPPPQPSPSFPRRNQEYHTKLVDVTLLVNKFLLFTTKSYMFPHLYQSHHMLNHYKICKGKNLTPYNFTSNVVLISHTLQQFCLHIGYYLLFSRAVVCYVTCT